MCINYKRVSYVIAPLQVTETPGETWRLAHVETLFDNILSHNS